MVKAAVDAIGRGGLIVFADDADRENEGDVVVAADADTPETTVISAADHGPPLRAATSMQWSPSAV